MAPYRMLHVWDLGTRADSSLLSRGAKVIERLEEIFRESNSEVQLRQLSIVESRQFFATAFDSLCSSLSSGATLEQIDRRHYGDSSYLTF